MMITPTRPHALLTALVALVSIGVAGCGYVYRAEIQGQIVDSDDDSGINRASVRVYEEEPSDPDSDGFLVKTESVTSGGTPGVFRTSVVWREVFGAFGTEADTTELWLGVTHPDYSGVVVEVRGILSDQANTVGEIALLDADRDPDAQSALVQGRVFEVVDGSREPVAGYAVGVEVTSTDGGPESDVDVPDTVRTGATGTFVLAVEWPEDSNIESVELELTYPAGAGENDEDAIRTITVEDGDNFFVQDVTINNDNDG